MADYDEFDALLEEPFGDDVDWTALDELATTVNATAGAQSDSEEYFSNDGGIDDAFLDEVQRLEEQAMGHLGGGAGTDAVGHSFSRTAFLHAAPRLEDGNSATDPRAIAGPSRPLTSRMAKKSTCRPPLPSPEQGRNSSPKQITPEKRPCIPSHFPDEVSLSKRGKVQTREAKSQVLETFESVLECPICFDIIAAAHSLSCGHSACGMCLNKWLHHDSCSRRATCFSCRARHKHALIPNFAVDTMAAAYFDEQLKNAEESGIYYVAENKTRWEIRRAEGKAAVQKRQKTRLKSSVQVPLL